MSCQLVPKSVTLDDLKRRNDPYLALFRRILHVASAAHCEKVVEEMPKLSVCSPKHLVSDISY